MGDALRYVHSKNVVHKDITCNNVFLDEHLNARLADVAGSSIDGSKTLDRLLGQSYASLVQYAGERTYWLWEAYTTISRLGIGPLMRRRNTKLRPYTKEACSLKQDLGMSWNYHRTLLGRQI